METATSACKRPLFRKAPERVPERDFGITGEVEPRQYEEMLRYCRDHGWMPVERVVRAAAQGLALEVGPGPGYLGLEWLQRTNGTRLVGYDISPDMLAIAVSKAKEYGLDRRAEYRLGDVRELPFADGSFDAVFSNDSFHEWAHPLDALGEINRVLKPGGVYHISDLRRDMSLALRVLIWIMCHPKTLRPGWLTSIDASYTRSELKAMLAQTSLAECQVEIDAMRFYIRGRKRGSGA